MKKYIEIERSEYIYKKLDAAKEILPVLIAQHSMDYITDVRKRASLVYNSVAMANELLEEAGLVIKGEPVRSKDPGEEVTAIRKLSELLKEDKK